MTGSVFVNNFMFREYIKGDFKGIEHLWSVTGLNDQKRGDNEKIVEESIRMGGCLIVMLEKDSGRICGTSWMTFDGRRIHLHHFGILPDFQGNGLANYLLEKSLDVVKKKGYQVKIEVHKTNKIAINLYEKYGFKPLGEYDIYIIRNILKL